MAQAGTPASMSNDWDIENQQHPFVGAANENLDLLSCLHTLCECAQGRSRDLHCLEFTCYRVKDALFDEVYSPRTARRTQRMASGVSENSLFTGFGADAWHKVGAE
jgi:hypothetical protein